MVTIGAKEFEFDCVTRDEGVKITEVDRAIDDVSLQIETGSFVAILGHNGSSKFIPTETPNGILLPSSGTVLISGMNTADDVKLLNIHREVGMVFQNPDNQVIANLIEDGVGFDPENLDVPTKEIWQRVDAALKAVGMTTFRLESPSHLSGGQKQCVAAAGVIAMHPKCIALDEPAAVLDPSGRRGMIRTATELNRNGGVMIVLVTHYMEEVIGADRLVVMDNGEVIMNGTPREVFARVEKSKRLRLDVSQAAELAYGLEQYGVNLPDSVLTMEELAEVVLPLRKEN